ncbi:MAG: aminotransferase class III-fold pyridoxal phosphate-dependent enzyme, partial [Clostridiales bacterium]|nr:aminotransferase class III-fold pyridoxal phosphate-dependent enzyme [Clostridiales bacterium]
AIMLEPVQGERGVNPAYTSYLEGVKCLCRENDLLLIFDEIQCGMNRTGALFAYESYGVEPDILTLAKALAGGFPIGAVLAKEKAAAFGPGDHAATFGGNPVACAAGVAAVESLLEENFLKKVNESAGYFKKKLNELAQKHDQVKEVRGLGFLLGMELNIEGKDIVKSCQDNGLLINCVNGNVLRFIPPLIVRQKEIDTAIDILDKVLAG